MVTGIARLRVFSRELGVYQPELAAGDPEWKLEAQRGAGTELLDISPRSGFTDRLLRPILWSGIISKRKDTKPEDGPRITRSVGLSW